MKKLIMILLLSAAVGSVMATGDGAPTQTEQKCWSCLQENGLLNWPSGTTRKKYLFQALEACPGCGVDIIQENFNN